MKSTTLWSHKEEAEPQLLTMNMEKREQGEDSPLNGQEFSRYSKVSAERRNRRCLVIGAILSCLVLMIIFGRAPASYKPFRSSHDSESDYDDDYYDDNDEEGPDGVTVAFVGNSMFYFNGAIHVQQHNNKRRHCCAKPFVFVLNSHFCLRMSYIQIFRASFKHLLAKTSYFIKILACTGEVVYPRSWWKGMPCIHSFRHQLPSWRVRRNKWVPPFMITVRAHRHS